MKITLPKNALELQNQLLEAFTAVRSGSISVELAKAQSILAREVINLMKLELEITRVLKVDPIYSPVRGLFGYDKKQISTNSIKDIIDKPEEVKEG